jgi:signal transduction histidine kinase
MESLLWQLSNRTAETLLILNLFHLLLAGLTLLVLLHRARRRDGEPVGNLLPAGFALLVLHFAVLTVYFGLAFFARKDPKLGDPERLFHGILIAAVLVLAAAYVQRARETRPVWLVPSLVFLALLVAADMVLDTQPMAGRPHSVFMLGGDAMGAAAAIVAILEARGKAWQARRVQIIALSSVTAVLLLHGVPSFVSTHAGIAVWNLDEHVLSFALFAFAWAAGEGSGKLLHRVFVRLNLTFVVLASVIILITAGMEKYQYFRLTEERSMSLGEFLRGHVAYYGAQGEDLQQILDHPEVMKRVVVEFGNLPELREVTLVFRGERARLGYQPGGEISESVTPAGPDDGSVDQQNRFRIVRLSLGAPAAEGYMEFTGTMEFVNERIGNYIIFIYSSFTLVLLVATGVIGIIVADADRQLTRRYNELQEAQQQLAQAAKLASVGELAGGMAHEINNPVTGILSLASHMAASNNNNSRLTPRERRNLSLIASQAERIAGLVRGLLSFSRQTQLHLTEVDVRELLRTALDLVRYRIDGASIELHREFASNLPSVTGDASRLTEVFVNLLSNAIDAMPGAGKLTLRAFVDPDNVDFVRVEVADTGIGIAPDELSRIFDPFFTTKPPGQGTGLGLSISHGIVRDHGGHIWAHSTREAGTTISVSLPQEVHRYEAACVGN